MSLISTKCPQCNESVQINDSKEHSFCMYCGTKIITKEATTPRDEAFVQAVLQKATEGNVSAMYEMGTLYRTGTGIKQDYDKAMEWYMRAAEKGDPFAMYNIGQMYSCGFGVKQNCAIAANWYAKATENGIGNNSKKSRSNKE